MRKKKQQAPAGYNFRPREYDRDERIALQKIVTTISVTRKLLSQELLVKATYNYVNKNIKQGQTAAHHVNTTEYPQLFFQSLDVLIKTTENLVKIEPFWRFEGHTPSEQLAEIENKRDAIIKGFLNDSFKKLVSEIESKKSPRAKQKLFDEYQAAVLRYSEICGEENFNYFKLLCEKMLGAEISEDESTAAEAVDEAASDESTTAEAVDEAASDESTTAEAVDEAAGDNSSDD